jgi:hypothetical protein
MLSFLLIDYWRWHYTGAYRDFAALARTGVWFIGNFFSIGLLAKTLFSPWKRMTDTRRAHDGNELLEKIITNLLSRVFGCMVRLVLIGLGLGTVVLWIALMISGFIVWTGLPVLWIVSFATGLRLFFS